MAANSITRGRLLDLMEVSEEPCTREDAARADEAFVVSTVREVMPVSGIEEADLPAPGPVTAEAARRLRERIEQELSALDPEDAREPA